MKRTLLKVLCSGNKVYWQRMLLPIASLLQSLLESLLLYVPNVCADVSFSTTTRRDDSNRGKTAKDKQMCGIIAWDMLQKSRWEQKATKFAFHSITCALLWSDWGCCNPGSPNTSLETDSCISIYYLLLYNLGRTKIIVKILLRHFGHCKVGCYLLPCYKIDSSVTSSWPILTTNAAAEVKLWSIDLCAFPVKKTTHLYDHMYNGTKHVLFALGKMFHLHHNVRRVAPGRPQPQSPAPSGPPCIHSAFEARRDWGPTFHFHSGVPPCKCNRKDSAVKQILSTDEAPCKPILDSKNAGSKIHWLSNALVSFGLPLLYLAMPQTHRAPTELRSTSRTRTPPQSPPSWESAPPVRKGYSASGQEKSINKNVHSRPGHFSRPNWTHCGPVGPSFLGLEASPNLPPAWPPRLFLAQLHPRYLSSSEGAAAGRVQVNGPEAECRPCVRTRVGFCMLVAIRWDNQLNSVGKAQ